MEKFTWKFYKMAVIVLVLLSAVLVITLPITAWLSSGKKQSRTPDLEIEMPPIIFINDDNLAELEAFPVDALRIGEEYNFLFCISPQAGIDVGSFDVGVIYTKNLGMEANLYPIESISSKEPAVGTLYLESVFEKDNATCYYTYRNGLWDKTSDIPDNLKCLSAVTTYGDWTNTSAPTQVVGDSVLNNGVYKFYSGMKFFSTPADQTETELINELNRTDRYRFFVLNITWDENVDAANAKEVDIIYLLARGKT